MGGRERAVKAFLLASAACWIGGAPAVAQVVLDGSLGPSGLLPGPDVTIPATVGQQAGSNLFHSFQTFSIYQGESATFTGPAGLANVISRVTGGDPSDIDGVLRSKVPDADFWFLNPAGVVFGPNARLDVPGSFHVSTADELRFPEGKTFSATEPGASVLSVAPPEAFGFLGAAPGAIRMAGASDLQSGLEVTPGHDLSLAGGDVTIVASFLAAPDGRIVLGSVAGPGEVGIGGEPSVGTDLGSIKLSDATARAFGPAGGGTVVIRGREITIDGALISVSSLGDGDSAGVDARASGDVSLTNSTVASITSGSGAAGPITIEGRNIRISDGSGISASTLSSGRGGNVRITASESVSLSGVAPFWFTTSGIATTSSASFAAEAAAESGSAGNIEIRAPELTMSSGSAVTSSTSSGGAAGIIDIDVDRLVLNEGASISSSTNSTGAGGEVYVRANESILISGRRDSGLLGVRRSGLFAESKSTAPDGGTAGRLSVIAGRLMINDGDISSLTEAGGAGGDITVDAGRVELTRSAVIRTDTRGTGPAGNVTVETNGLELISGSRIQSNTYSTGPAGTVTIDARDGIIAMAGRDSDGAPSGLLAGSLTQAPDGGPAGRVDVAAERLTVSENAVIESSTGGGGAGGDVNVNVGSLELTNGGQIRAQTWGPSAAGDLVISAQEAITISGQGTLGFESNFSNASGVFANSERLAEEGAERESGPAGRVSVSAERVAVGEGGLILSSAGEAGDGGEINLKVDRLELTRGGQVAVTTFGPGDAGDVTITAHDSISIAGRSPSATTAQPLSGIFASSASGEPEAGQSGTIRLSAPQIDLADGGRISIQREGGDLAEGDGNPQVGKPPPGNIFIEDTDILRMSDGASITAETARADAGDIVIQVDELIDLEDSAITTSVAGGMGGGGNISIDPRFLVLDSSRIIANAREGAGGNIGIVADFIFRSPKSVIDASSEFGISGTVAIAATELDVTSGVVTLPAAFLDPAALRPRCGGRDGGTGSFTGIGRGGTGVAPDAPLPGFYSDLTESTGSSAATAAPTASAAPPPPSNEKSRVAARTWLTSCRGE